MIQIYGTEDGNNEIYFITEYLWEQDHAGT
jgi:hypothetical protein